MPVQVNDTLEVLAPKPADKRYYKNGTTPYASVADANATLTAYRYKGLTVLIAGTPNAEYWYRDGTADTDLIAKLPSGGTGTVTFTNANGYFDDGVGGFTPTTTATVSNSSVYGLNDPITGEPVVYKEVTTFKNGTTITDAHIDGVMIRKKGTKYYKRVADNGIKANWYLAPGTADSIAGGISQNAVKLQKALNYLKANGGGTLEFWDGDYTVTPTAAQQWCLKPSSNIQIKGCQGARILCGNTGLGGYQIIYITNVDNVIINGLEVVGDRDTNVGDGSLHGDGSYYGGESGMGIYVERSSRVVLQDVKVSKCWGDGAYIGGGAICTNVLIDGCYFDNNRRNNITATWVDGLVISNSFFTNANGTAPENGIDLEPNLGTVVRNVLMTNLTISGNKQTGLGISGEKVKALNCNIINNGAGFIFSGLGVNNDNNNECIIDACTIARNGASGVLLTGSSGRITITNSFILANGGAITFNVTGITTAPAIDTAYFINGLEYTVKATNIVSGNGTISAICTIASGKSLPASGILALHANITFNVTGITSTHDELQLSQYNINGWQYIVKESNITAGTGTITMELMSASGVAIPVSGTMQKTAGNSTDSVISFSAWSKATAGDIAINYSSFQTKTDQTGVYITAPGYVTLKGNKILNNVGRAIFGATVGAYNITGNIIAGNTAGAAFNNSNGVFSSNIVEDNDSIINNSVLNSEGAVTFYGSNWAITGNTIFRNKYHGLYLWGSNCTVSGNGIYGNSQVADNLYRNISVGNDSCNNTIIGNTIHKYGGLMTFTVSGMSTIPQMEGIGIAGSGYMVGNVKVIIRSHNLTGTAPNIGGTLVFEPVNIDGLALTSSGTLTKYYGAGDNSVTYTAYTTIMPDYGIHLRPGGLGVNNIIAHNGVVEGMGKISDILDQQTSNVYPASPVGSRAQFDVGGALGVPIKWVSTNDATKKLDGINDNLIVFDATNGSFTFELATAVTANKRIFEFKRIDTNTNAVVTITTEGGGHYIDDSGVTSYLLYAQNSQGVSEIKLYCTDPNWKILSTYTAQDVPTPLTYAATTNINFNAGKTEILDLTGNVIFTTSNRIAGREKMIRITAGAADRTFTFPAWKFLNSVAPTGIVNGKTAVLSLSCFGVNDTDIIATYAIEPDLA